jgi:hypothetical protein
MPTAVTSLSAIVLVSIVVGAAASHPKGRSDATEGENNLAVSLRSSSMGSGYRGSVGSHTP